MVWRITINLLKELDTLHLEVTFWGLDEPPGEVKFSLGRYVGLRELFFVLMAKNLECRRKG